MLRILGQGHAETSDQMNDILAQVRRASPTQRPRTQRAACL